METETLLFAPCAYILSSFLYPIHSYRIHTTTIMTYDASRDVWRTGVWKVFLLFADREFFVSIYTLPFERTVRRNATGGMKSSNEKAEVRADSRERRNTSAPRSSWRRVAVRIFLSCVNVSRISRKRCDFLRFLLLLFSFLYRKSLSETFIRRNAQPSADSVKLLEEFF